MQALALPPAIPSLPTPRRPRSWVRWVMLTAVVVAGVVGGWWFLAGRPGGAGRPAGSPESPSSPPDGVRVQVVRPTPGGLPRLSVQPGTVEPFESADLYAKASGFLAEQGVDIGSRVTAGDVLARLSVPEAERQVDRDRAGVKDAAAKVRQFEAQVNAAGAEAKAADATVALNRGLVRAKTAYRRYREKQLTRLKELNASQAIDARIVDEQEDFFLSAQEAENAAKEAVTASLERVTAARAKVVQTEADVDAARAAVGVAEAVLARSEVLSGYAVVRSPYTGVVTRRSFHVGDFIRSADGGGATPLLTVERTDKMRLVVQVPDRDVGYVDAGDPVTLDIDALPGRPFASTVARTAGSEDPATRLMRTEIDLPNPDGRLRRGMYGKATLVLDAGAAGAVRVPSAAVTRSAGGKPTVAVVRDGKVHLASVTLGTDNGVEIEVVTGLTPADVVVLRANGPVAEGTAVTESAPPAAR